MNEKIICAAVWYKELKLKLDVPLEVFLPINIEKGIVFCGHRHGQCIYTKCAITGLKDCESGEQVQGFLTNLNRFVDRVEAWEIAKRENQILPEYLGDGNRNYLFSEDLY